MIYVDTSVLVALILPEPKSTAVIGWYGACTDELVSAAWCVTEFASALGIKQRTGQIDETQRQAAWQRFERLCVNDLQLLPVEPVTFYRAGLLTLDATTGLRAGDALHLAAAMEAKAQSVATLDRIFGENAHRLKLNVVEFVA
jgi:predicted nucleic acid-binding protein